MTFFDQLIFSVCIVAFIYTLVFVSRRKPGPYYFFIAGYFFIAYTLLLNYMAYTGIIVDYPHLYRTASPLQYLSIPLGYFFVLYTVKPGRRFRYYDLLHLLPFLLHVFELLPFYFTSTAEKTLFVRESSQSIYTLWNTLDGLYFTYREHVIFKGFLMMVYVLFQWRLIIRYRMKWDITLRKQNRVLLGWIQFETFLKTLMCIFLFISVSFIHLKSILAILPTALMIGYLLSAFIYTMLFPSLLSGIQPVSMEFSKLVSGLLPVTDNCHPELQMGKKDMKEEDDDSDDVQVQTPKNRLQAKKIFAQLELYMQTEQPFLDFNLSRTILAKNIRIPARKLSDIIKTETGLSFSDYINNYRINYLESKLKADKNWKNFTIEAIAVQSGFYTRSAFNNALKRLKNETPTDLLTRVLKNTHI